MADLNSMDGIAPTIKHPSIPKPRQYKRRATDPLVTRRNPGRGARYTPYSSPPTTRSRGRRGSVSSASSSSSSTQSSPGKQTEGRLLVRFGSFMKRPADLDVDDDVYDSDNDEKVRPVNRRRQQARNIKSAEEIDDLDLKMVAAFVSDKRYDSVNGTSCHQCRQKTDDQKTICRSETCTGVRGQFCGPCLRNRYGEDAKDALKDADWECPPCRGICNCSFCRKKNGKGCTGILIHLARGNGFPDVNSYLDSLKHKK